MRVYAQQLSPTKACIPDGDLSPDARAAWLYMRDKGGWYTAAELSLELMPGVPVFDGARMVSRWLVALMRRNHVARKPAGVLRGKSVFSHGVTARCVPIPGESLEPAN